MTVDLQALLSLEPGHTDALDWFISSCLYDGGIWESPRTSDGIHSTRVLAHASDELRVYGRIWELDQSLHTFWLELKRDGSGEGEATIQDDKLTIVPRSTRPLLRD